MSQLVILQKEDLRSELLPEISDLLDKKLEVFFSRFQQPQPAAPQTKLKSRNEAAKFLGVSLNTLGDWTKHGIVKGYRVNSRVRYKQEDLEACLRQIQSARRIA